MQSELPKSSSNECEFTVEGSALLLATGSVFSKLCTASTHNALYSVQ